MLDIDKLEQAALAATPGPWKYNTNLGWAYPQTNIESANGTQITRFVDGELQFSCTVGKAELEWKNAEYIAAANPSTVLELINRLKLTTKEVNKWK